MGWVARDATVTDAYVCLGIIDPTKFLGGRVSLNPRLAEEALATLGQRIGLSVRATAEAILRVATSQMYSALVPLLARKGIGYEEFTLLAFGGGGPSHAFMLARDVGIGRILVPPHPGVLCAAGSLAADVRKDLVYTVHAALAGPETKDVVGEMRQALDRLSKEGAAWLAAQGLSFVAQSIEWTADMRYVGQSFELTVALAETDFADPDGALIKRRFHRAYEQVYGYQDENAALEVLDVRVTAIGHSPKPPIAQLRETPGAQPPTSRAPARHLPRRAELVRGCLFARGAVLGLYLSRPGDCRAIRHDRLRDPGIYGVGRRVRQPDRGISR